MARTEPVRQPVQLRDRSRRTLEERLLMRSPRLAQMMGRAFARLPVQSRLRQRGLRHRVRQGYEAMNRRDMDAALAANHPDVELHTAKDDAGVPFGADFDDVYYGREGLAAAWRLWLDAWEDARLEAEEVIDCGDRFLVLLRFKGRGKGSGVELDKPLAQILTLRDGLVARTENYWERANAFKAVGLSMSESSSGS